MNSQSYLQEFIKECSEAKPAATDEKFVGWENIIFILDAAKLIFFRPGYARRISNVCGSDKSAVSSDGLYASRPEYVPTSSRQRRTCASQACASAPRDWPVGC